VVATFGKVPIQDGSQVIGPVILAALPRSTCWDASLKTSPPILETAADIMMVYHIVVAVGDNVRHEVSLFMVMPHNRAATTYTSIGDIIRLGSPPASHQWHQAESVGDTIQAAHVRDLGNTVQAGQSTSGRPGHAGDWRQEQTAWPFFLPSGVLPVFLPYTTLLVMVNTDSVGTLLR